MFRYGLLFGVVGTIVCVTTESKSQLPYKPVCGVDGKTYAHADVVNVQNAEGEDSNLKAPHEVCSNQARIKRSTSACSTEVREVCGTDGVTYKNACELNQAHTPENNVTLSHFGSCTNKTFEAKTNKTNYIKETTDEVPSNPINKEDLAQQISELDGVQEVNDAVEKKTEGYVENIEDANNEVKNLEVEIKNQTENIRIVPKDRIIELKNNLNTSDILDKQTKSVIQNTSNVQMKIKMDSEKSIFTVQNASDVNDQNTSDGKDKNKTDNFQISSNKPDPSNKGFEGYTKVAKNKSRKRRNVENLANEEQNQSELKEEKYKNKSVKTKKHRTETASASKSNGVRNSSGKSRKIRDVQNVANSNGNNMNEKFETKRGKPISRKGINESKKSKHGNVEIKLVDEVQGKSKESKTKLEKSRKKRDMKREANVISNGVQNDNAQGENEDGMSNHIRLSRNVKRKTNKNIELKSKDQRDKKAMYGKVRKTRGLKKPSLSKKELKPTRGMKFGGEKQKKGSKDATRAA